MRTVRVTDLVYNGLREIASKIGAKSKLRVVLLLGLALFLLPVGMAGAQAQSYAGTSRYSFLLVH